MSKTLKLGFIGTGGIARTQMATLHARDDVEFVAFADASNAALDSAANRYSVAARYTDWRKMLKNEQLDAVSVCTPNQLHAAPTIAALRAGVHVLCEKPMASSVAEAKRMLRAVNETERKLVIGF